MINYGGTIEPKESTIVESLPVGAYVGKVVGAEIKKIESSNGDFERLELRLDVTEGEHKDYYSKLYESQSGGSYPVRWKGVIRFNIPQVGSQYEHGQKKALEHLAWCLQDSNPKYKWDGDETKLASLKIGFSVRERDWIMERDGELLSGTTTEIGRVESTKNVLAGNVKPMRKRELKNSDKEKLALHQERQVIASTDIVDIGNDDLPF